MIIYICWANIYADAVENAFEEFKIMDIAQKIGSVIPIAKDFIIAISAAIAAYVGIKGLNTWRRQLKGNAEYKLAKTLLIELYGLREAIATARSALQFSAKPQLEKEQQDRMSPEQIVFEAIRQSWDRRWARISERMIKVDTALLEAEAIWGETIVKKVATVRRQVNKFFWAITEDLESRNPEHPASTELPEERKKRQNILYSIREDNEFDKDFNNAIHEVESELKSHIGGRYR